MTMTTKKKIQPQQQQDSSRQWRSGPVPETGTDRSWVGQSEDTQIDGSVELRDRPRALRLKPKRINQSKGKKTYNVEYQDKVGKFYNGGDPSGIGIEDVDSYKASVVVWDDEDDQIYSDSVSIDADTHEYHQGHLLQKNLGGSGDLDNIFEQDGGQNTTGDWVSFERNASNAADRMDADEMNYKITLKGNDLDYKF